MADEDSQLIADLHKLHEKAPKLVRSSEYSAPAMPELIVSSWKMNEFKYYDIPSPFPTLARGLFSAEEKVPGEKTRYRIVARGYDKFFNIGEVPWTTWSALEDHTNAPYTLTLKSNGCIIFIAALSPSKLLVTSKHSLGPVKGADESHAQAGERWLHRHLQTAGKTTEQLAKVLYEKKWTAVAELCDDNFEEHVLPYPPEKTGLHLHGLNEATKLFKTMPPTVVDAFAAEWGFIPTASTVLNSIPEVKAFTEEIGRVGKWNGEAIEGFVVRTTVSAPPTDGRAQASASPYAPGSSFFFKVKFDEPYMMYRDWREVTKSLLSCKGPLSEAKIPKSKMKRPETIVYIRWVKEQIQKNPGMFVEYNKGKGIIATREKFLEWLATQEGKEVLAAPEGSRSSESAGDARKFGKTIIVPIAIPGVGKTSVAVALAHLFGFGHTQSDDVKAKKPAPQFIKNVLKLLNEHDVVIADKNNHLQQHRQALRDAVKGMDPPVRLLALNWSLDQPQSTIARVCGDRVLVRGDNHQTLRADADAKAHEDVIWQFINSTEGLADDEVDETIEMDLTESLEDSVERAINGCVAILGLQKPDREKIGEALAVVRGYAPSTIQPEGKKPKTRAPRYFGLLPELDLPDVLGQQLSGQIVPPKSKEFWEHLKEAKRVAPRPHITIVHSKSLPGEVELWDRCMALHRTPNPPLFRIKLGHVVSNDRVMAVTVDALQVDDVESDEGQEGREFVTKLWDETRQRLHITVGTRNADILPVEAKDLVEKWRRGKADKDTQVAPLEAIYVKGRIKGLNS
ncbi:RNA ligase [Artomyces pyxidatus]|uniref:RNA ligase n=1 Tax=Artomyces pyxidatus TaxID=48021 RepID=A0ACB8T6C1_9AGAM|nr:RNA ligase [Artomyces pyxidatus]